MMVGDAVIDSGLRRNAGWGDAGLMVGIPAIDSGLRWNDGWGVGMTVHMTTRPNAAGKHRFRLAPE